MDIIFPEFIQLYTEFSAPSSTGVFVECCCVLSPLCAILFMCFVLLLLLLLLLLLFFFLYFYSCHFFLYHNSRFSFPNSSVSTIWIHSARERGCVCMWRHCTHNVHPLILGRFECCCYIYSFVAWALSSSLNVYFFPYLPSSSIFSRICISITISESQSAREKIFKDSLQDGGAWQSS